MEPVSTSARLPLYSPMPAAKLDLYLPKHTPPLCRCNRARQVTDACLRGPLCPSGILGLRDTFLVGFWPKGRRADFSPAFIDRTHASPRQWNNTVKCSATFRFQSAVLGLGPLLHSKAVQNATNLLAILVLEWVLIVSVYASLILMAQASVIGSMCRAALGHPA